jgi:hypothetical protein
LGVGPEVAHMPVWAPVHVPSAMRLPMRPEGTFDSPATTSYTS